MSRPIILATCLVTLTCCSGGGGATPTPTPTPVAINSAPSVTVVNTSIVYEEVTKIVSRISASDADGDSLTYSLAGVDSDVFSLEFDDIGPYIIPLSSLNFEAPVDANGDNIYQLELNVSDGEDSSIRAFSVTVTDIEKDGILHITDADFVFPAPDLTGDHISDIIVVSRNDGSGGVIVSGGALVVEEDAQISTSSIYFPLTGERSGLGIQVDDPNFILSPRLRFENGQTVSEGSPLSYLSITGQDFVDTSANFNYDTAVVFPDTFLGALSGSNSLDLRVPALPLGVRSSRGQTLEAFFPIGDLNGDGNSEVIAHGNFASSTDSSIVASYSVIDGAEIRNNAVGSLFTNIDSINDHARQLTFPINNFIRLPILNPVVTGFRGKNKLDVTGDEIDDFIVMIELSDGIPPPPNGFALSNGYAIEIISGTSLMSSDPGEISVESLNYPDRLRVTFPSDFAQPLLADVVDLNEDGYSDLVILTQNNNDPGSRGRAFDAFIVSGKALADAPDGILNIADLPGPGGTAIRAHSIRGQLVDDAFTVGNMVGGSSPDLLLVENYNTDSFTNNKAVAILISGDLFQDGFPEVLDLADQQTSDPTDSLNALDVGLAALSVGLVTRIDGPAVERSGNIGRTGFLREHAGTPIGDGDGDGYPDLALVRATERGGTFATKDVFIVPSGLIRAAIETGDIVQIDNSFDK